MSSYKISDSFAATYADAAPPWGFNGLGYITFKRTYARPFYDETGENVVRTEEWHEAVQRVVNGAQDVGADLTADEAMRLYDYIFNLKASVAGRMLWALGTTPPEETYADAFVNCWFVDVHDTHDFAWALERMMLGGGVGFSVDRSKSLGVVKSAKVTHVDGVDSDFIVPDKREGWGELIYRLIQSYFVPEFDEHHRPTRIQREWTFSTHLIRPFGTPIKTFGGTASGPTILIEGVEKISAILDAAVDRELTSVDILDIQNIIGSIVVAGNVRRSAEIALGSPFDQEFLAAKRWDLGNIPSHRAMSNNSLYVDAHQMKILPDEVWEGYTGNGEPYGFVNLDAAQQFGRTGEERMDLSIAGFNPCGEIPLANRESCNLSTVFLPNIESMKEFKDVATLLYKVQKAVASLPYLDPGSDAIAKRNMRLGLGVGGVLQSTQDQLSWLSPTYEHLRAFDAEWSAAHDWPASVRLTTVKPDGTASLLPGVTPGGHPGYSQFFMKNMRMSAHDPLVEYCRDRGYYVEPVRNFDGTEDSRTVVVSFPCSFPDGTLLAQDMTAIDQLEVVKMLQRDWSDNAVSVTVYYRLDELDVIKEWLVDNWADMKSVSFLLHSDHGFDQAPLVELTQAEYEAEMAKVLPLGAATSANTLTTADDLALDDACAGGACPVR